MYQSVPIAIVFAMLSLFGWGVRSGQGAASTPTPPAGVAILSPLPGQALQGSVPIIVNTGSEGFRSAELEFAYLNNPTNTWFSIWETTQPVINDILAQWDTSTISDGNYTLRLSVYFTDGHKETFMVAGVRVRNYSPIETDTPTPHISTATAVPEITPTVVPTPTSSPITPTALPANPLQLSRQEVFYSLGKGALLTILGFALAGLYHTIRSLFRR